MSSEWISFALSNFGLLMLVCAIFFMLLNRILTKGRVSEYEIIYRWLALFSLGFTGIYAFYMHAFQPDIAASTIGWANSPFQYEVAMADLGFGIIGLLSFNASYSFRLATVIGNTIWLWGDASGHIFQMLQNQNFSTGNAGSWFWLDVFIPLLLMICLSGLKRSK